MYRPPPYPPSGRSVNDLQPLMISHMTLETHHRGKKVIIRALTPPDRLNAVLAIVEDEEGTAFMLQLCKQPEEAEVSKENILQENKVYIIKEPFFEDIGTSAYSLRVDHATDFVYLTDDDERIPRKWRTRPPRLEDDSQQLRMKGNIAVQNGKWAGAKLRKYENNPYQNIPYLNANHPPLLAQLCGKWIRLLLDYRYSSAIHAATTMEQSQLAYLNRSLANLGLGRSEKALEDTRKGGDSEKALFREARALYGLGKFDECLEKFQVLVKR